MMRALLWKEFREQAERWLLATILLAGTTALLVHARIISVRESLVTVLLLGGLVLSIVLIIAPLPSEISHRTLDFLLARPIERRRILLAKWIIGAASIAAMYAACCVGGLIAAWSADTDALWLLPMAGRVCVAMLAYHSLFFLALPRVRSELDAAIYAFFLAVITFIWFAAMTSWMPVAAYFGHLSPGAPIFAMLYNQKGPPEPPHEFSLRVLPTLWSTLLTGGLWVIAPYVWLARPRFRRRFP